MIFRGDNRSRRSPSRLHILGATVFLLLLLVVQWLYSPVRRAWASVAMLHAFSEGFTYSQVEKDYYLPAAVSEQSLQQTEAALKQLAAWPAIGDTAEKRTRAVALAARARWNESLAVLANAQPPANQVVAVTRAAVLERVRAAQIAPEQQKQWRNEEGKAWAQAFGSIDAILRIGAALQATDKLGMATHLYERATVAYPQYREPWYYLADLYATQGKAGLAIETLNQGLAATRTVGSIGQSNLYYLIARIRGYTPALNDPRAVRHAYAKAAALHDFGTKPGDELDLHFQLGHLAYADKRWPEALAEYKQALALNPAEYYPQLTIAATLWQLGKHSQAIAQLENAIRDHPENKTAYQWLADLHRHAGNTEQAKQALQRLLSIDPSDTVAHQASQDLRLLPAYVPGL